VKSYADLLMAKKRVSETIYANPNLSDLQKTVLMGMSVALQWASDTGGDSLQRLLDGEPLDVGKTLPVPDLTKAKRT